MLITEIISLLQLIHITSSRVPRPDFFEVKKKSKNSQMSKCTWGHIVPLKRFSLIKVVFYFYGRIKSYCLLCLAEYEN